VRHVVYGDRADRDTRALLTALSAKGLAHDFIEETPVLSLALAARAGCERGPYLRTPEGFVLGDVHALLDHLERVAPVPPWLPRTPVRRACARILEDWIERWLPIWPARARSVLEGLAKHLAATGCLMGPSPCRPDGALAAWLDADVLSDPELREYLARHAPRLARYAGEVRRATASLGIDDALPLPLLSVLAEIAGDYHVYLERNRAALLDGRDRVEVDFGLGAKWVPVSRGCESRRAAIGREIAALSERDRRTVRQMLEPLGIWRVVVLPEAQTAPALDDPRSV